MVECCVHGKPCIIGKKLSSKVSDNDEENEESEVPSPAPGYEYMQRSGSSESKSKTISYGLKRKVERDVLDVPLCDWNQGRSSSSQTDSFGGTIGLPSNCEKIAEKRTEGESFRQESPIRNRRVERVPLFNAEEQRTYPRSAAANRAHSNFDVSPPNAYDTVPTGAIGDDLSTAQLVTEKEQAAAIRAAYIGPLKKKEAEEYVLKPTSFKIYHRMPNIRSLDNITSDLPLYVVYRSGRGKIQFNTETRWHHVSTRLSRSFTTTPFMCICVERKVANALPIYFHGCILLDGAITNPRSYDRIIASKSVSNDGALNGNLFKHSLNSFTKHSF